ncbi:hypothetical protein RIX33_001508 [Vibrio vulnificus]|nr:hypothetical protein [Vibrio vulnificus]
MKVNIVVIKLPERVNWSSSIKRHVEVISECCREKGHSFDCFEFSRPSLNLYKSIFNLYRNKGKLTILAHHTLPLWLLIPVLPLVDYRIHSFSHEGEVLFSLREKLAPKNFKGKISNLLRGSYLYHSIPRLFVYETIFLSELYEDTIFSRNKKTMHFLGVDKHCERKKHSADIEKYYISLKGSGLKLFFPHDISRRDKGFDIINNGVIRRFYSIYYPNSCPNQIMHLLYDIADVVVIPTMTYETYSLCLIEAICHNKLVVVSDKAGLAYSLKKKYGNAYLESLGLFVVPVSKFQSTLTDLHQKVTGGMIARTEEIYKTESLDVYNCASRAFNHIVKNDACHANVK